MTFIALSLWEGIYVAVTLVCVIIAFIYGWREGYVSARRQMRMARSDEVVASALSLKSRGNGHGRPELRSRGIPPDGSSDVGP